MTTPWTYSAAEPVLAHADGADPSAPDDRIWVAPALPPSIHRCRIDGIDVAGRRLTVDVDGDTCQVTRAQGFRVSTSPRSPIGSMER